MYLEHLEIQDTNNLDFVILEIYTWQFLPFHYEWHVTELSEDSTTTKRGSNLSWYPSTTLLTGVENIINC